MSASSKAVPGPIQGVTLKPRSPIVNWECRYLAKIDIANFEFNLQKATAEGSSVGYGNFLSGFSLQIFSNAGRTDQVTDNSVLFIGAPVYAKTTWTTPVDSLNYFIDSCTITQGSANVQIIKDNCYSTTLGSKRGASQSTYKVEKDSLFEWISFRTEGATLGGNIETIKCSLQVCKKDSTICPTKTVCPDTAGYAFTLTGQ